MDIVTQTDLQGLLKNHPKMGIKEPNNKDGFLIENPPFGFNYRIVALPERNVGTFRPNLKKIVESRNNLVKERYLAFHINNSYVDTNKDEIIAKLDKLYQSLLSECVPTINEKLLFSANLRIKKKALEIINNSIKEYQTLDRQSDDFFLLIAITLNSLKQNLDSVSNGIPNAVLKKLISEIDELSSSNLLTAPTQSYGR